MRHRDQLELFSAKLEVEVVHVCVWLEAPGERAREVIREAVKACLVNEQVHPGFEYVRTNSKVL